MGKVLKGMLKIVESTLLIDDFDTLGAPGISAGNLDFLPIQRVVKLLPELAENTSDLLREFGDQVRKNLGNEIPSPKVFDPQVLLPSGLKPKVRDISFVLLVYKDIVDAYRNQVFEPDVELPDTNAQMRALLRIAKSKQTGLPPLEGGVLLKPF